MAFASGTVSAERRKRMNKKAWETVYQNVLRLQEEYRNCGDVRNVYECIKLQEMLLEYKEQLTEEG